MVVFIVFSSFNPKIVEHTFSKRVRKKHCQVDHRPGGALRLALPLLTSTPFACAFAAQSLAQRARIGAPEDAAEWPEVSLHALGRGIWSIGNS